MNNKILLLVLLNIVAAKVSIEIDFDKHNNVILSHSGHEEKIVQDADVKLFKIDSENLKKAFNKLHGKRPSSVYLKTPTPWGDPFAKYKWEQVTKVLSIQSARVKGITKRPVVLVSEDYENLTNNPMKIKTEITYTIKNTVTTSWSSNSEVVNGLSIAYNINLGFAKMGGGTGFSRTSSSSNKDEKVHTESYSTNAGMEMELKPGDAVTVALCANVGTVEIEVTYKASLKGNVLGNYHRRYKGFHFWAPAILNLMSKGGISNEIIVTDTILIKNHLNISLQTYNKPSSKKVGTDEL